MKPALQLRLGTSLTMTPQLQQAIKLLQLSSLELTAEINEVLVENPLLEQVESQTEPQTEPQTEAAKESESDFDAADSAMAKPEGLDTLPDTDNDWDRHFEAIPTATPKERQHNTADRQIDIPDVGTDNLRENLLWQLNLAPFTESDQCIALSLIDAVGADGYLTESVAEILQSLPPELELQLEEVEAVRHRLQRFDPLGVASCNLQECLLVQLQALDEGTEHRQHALELVSHYLALWEKQDLVGLQRKLKMSQEQLMEVLALVRRLEPRPGERISAEPAEYVVPEVYIKKKHGQWVVTLNSGVVPELKINDYYASLIRKTNGEDAKYLRAQLQEARWFLKSMETRNETVLKVAQCIVLQQQSFFEHGPEAMKPLILRDIAEQIDMHESTISRVTSRKYMHTPRGVFEFKYFFSSHVSTADGGECSATAIRAMIQRLVDEEPPNRPLSDSKLGLILNQNGIKVARRTVAKYREANGIPSSTERRRLM